MVRAHRIGVLAEPGDVAGVVRVLRDLARDRSSLEGAYERARAHYEREFGRATQLRVWAELFSKVTT